MKGQGKLNKHITFESVLMFSAKLGAFLLRQCTATTTTITIAIVFCLINLFSITPG